MQGVARGQHQDGDPVTRGAQAAGDLQAVQAREHEVEDERVVSAALGPLQPLPPVVGHVNHVPLLGQPAPQQVGQRPIVLYYQQMHRPLPSSCAFSSSRVRRCARRARLPHPTTLSLAHAGDCFMTRP